MDNSYLTRAKETLLPWTHWKFLLPRKDQTASQLIEIADTAITGNPDTDTVIIMDIKAYAKGEKRKFTTVPARDFLTLIDKKQVEVFVPKI